MVYSPFSFMIICTFPLDIQSPQNSGSSSALFAHHILETSHFEDLPQQWLWHCQNVLLRKTPLGMIFHGMKRRSHSSSWSCGRKTMSYGFWMSYYYDGAMILCSKPLQTSPYNKVEIIYKQSSQTSFLSKTKLVSKWQAMFYQVKRMLCRELRL